MVLNSESLTAKYDQIYSFLINKRPLIACVTEARITEQIQDHEIEIDGYFICRVDSDSRHTGGVLLYIREGVEVLDFKRSVHHPNWWLSETTMVCDGRRYVVVSLYHSPNGSHRDFLDFFEE